MAPISGQQLLQQHLTTPEARAAWQRWVAALPAPAAAPVAASLGPMQEAQLLSQQNAINSNYATQKAQSLFQQGQAEADWMDQISNAKRKFLMMRQQMPYGFNARGMLGSGVWKRALGDFNLGIGDQLRQMERQRAGMLGQFRLGRQNLVSQRDQQLADLRAAAAAARQQQSLNSLNLGLGG
jgi:cell division septum initiation protein DivIVA